MCLKKNQPVVYWLYHLDGISSHHPPITAETLQDAPPFCRHVWRQRLAQKKARLEWSLRFKAAASRAQSREGSWFSGKFMPNVTSQT